MGRKEMEWSVWIVSGGPLTYWLPRILIWLFSIQLPLLFLGKVDDLQATTFPQRDVEDLDENAERQTCVCISNTGIWRDTYKKKSVLVYYYRSEGKRWVNFLLTDFVCEINKVHVPNTKKLHFYIENVWLLDNL